jgi:exonuclease VII small subunit
MKDKNLPPDNSKDSLEELTDQANKIIETLENEKDLNNSIENYQQLLKLNKVIEKKFHSNLKSINEQTNQKVKKILKRSEK